MKENGSSTYTQSVAPVCRQRRQLRAIFLPGSRIFIMYFLFPVQQRNGFRTCLALALCLRHLLHTHIVMIASASRQKFKSLLSKRSRAQDALHFFSGRAWSLHSEKIPLQTCFGVWSPTHKSHVLPADHEINKRCPLFSTSLSDLSIT